MFKEDNKAHIINITRKIADKHGNNSVFVNSTLQAAYDMYDYLRICSQNTNLVGDLSEDTYVLRHFLDSVAFLAEYEIKSGASIADLGSGAGFPGIPISILRPDLKIFSVESIGKKADFQKSLLNTINIGNCEVINSRIEEVGRSELRETMDFVSSRALDTLSVLCEYALPLLKIGGKTLFFKSDSIEHELNDIEKPLVDLGGVLEEVFSYRVSEDQAERKIVIVRKEKATQDKYPRRTGIPHKRPLK